MIHGCIYQSYQLHVNDILHFLSHGDPIDIILNLFILVTDNFAIEREEKK